MTKLVGDVVNRVRRLPKPSKATQALQPMFEGLSNAFHAIGDRFQADASNLGRVVVNIRNLADADTIEIVINDNGIGLGGDRFKAFCTTDTSFKMKRGGKGVGRLLWLDAFEEVRVRSVFREGEQDYARTFDFVLSDGDQLVNEELKGKPSAVAGQGAAGGVSSPRVVGCV